MTIPSRPWLNQAKRTTLELLKGASVYSVDKVVLYDLG